MIRRFPSVRSFAVAVLLAAAFPATADVGVAPEPPAGWTAAVEQIGEVLQGGDVAGLGSHCTADTVIRSLSGAPRTQAGVVAAALRSTPLLRRAYVFPSLTIASDLAAAAETDLPNDLARPLRLSTPEEAAAADDTAKRWVERLLPVDAGDLVAVFVYVPTAPAAGSASGPIFVIVRGAGTDRGFGLTHIAVGSP